VFNFQREVTVLYAHAFTKRQAWLVMCKRLAKKHGVIPLMVMNYFDGEKPNYEISLEMEIAEDAES
jgi:hypothetical protein